jgi:hypothetical protein
MSIYVAASNVAALIGRHKYRSREQALLETLDRQKDHSFASIQAGLRADAEISRQLDKLGSGRAAQALPAVLQRASESAPVAQESEFSGAQQIRQELLKAKTTLTTQLEDVTEHHRDLRACIADPAVAKETECRLLRQVQEKLQGSYNAREAATRLVKSSPRGRSFKAISRRIKAHFAAKVLSDKARLDEEDATRKKKRAEAIHSVSVGTKTEVRRLRDGVKREAERLEREVAATTYLARADDAEVQEAAGRAALQRRGEVQEATVLDVVAARERTTVAERNASVERYVGENYVVVGRVDGVTEDGCIVEVKTRKNWFARPPDYDVVQLQVYLRLRGAQEGVLEESSQRDPGLWRSTKVTCNDQEWEQIDEQLREASREIREASLETARTWARAIE